MFRFLSDQNFDQDIVRGLLTQSLAVDFVHVSQVNLSAADDNVVLDWAADDGRVVLSHDRNTMTAAAYERLVLGLSMPGLIIVDDPMATKKAIHELAIVVLASAPAECDGQVLFLPMR